MNHLASSQLHKTLLAAAAAVVSCATALGGGELFAPPELLPAQPGYGAAPGAVPGVVPAGVAGGVYNEYYTYGAYVRRSYMPGYIPQTASLFENPRTLPAALCKFSDYYRFAGINGWFFASPNGYQSSVPPGSTAHAYETGRLGITTSMQYGYPRGMRVIEPIMVPFASYAEPAGLLITSDGIAVREGAPMPVRQQVTETVTQIEKTGAPEGYQDPMRVPEMPQSGAPMAPPPLRMLPEVVDK